MGLADSILANEKVMDKLAQLYAHAVSGYYGSDGRRGTDKDAKKSMIYYLEQECGVCRAPSAISSMLDKIIDKIQERARDYGYSGPINRPVSSARELPPHLQKLAEQIRSDEEIMRALGNTCLWAARTNAKNMMSEKNQMGYVTELQEWARYKNLGFLDAYESKEIIKYLKKDITRYAKIIESEKESNSMTLNESQLKTLLAESVKRVLREWRYERRGLTSVSRAEIVVNGRDFLKKATGLGDAELAGLAERDNAVREILGSRFNVTAEASSFPGHGMEPAEDNFEIVEDDALMDIIEEVEDQRLKSMLLKAYEDQVEGADFDFADESDFADPDYVGDQMRDNIRENADEKRLRPRKNNVFSTDDPNSLSRVKNLKQDYDPFLYGLDPEIEKNKKDLSGLIAARSRGEESSLPLPHNYEADIDDSYFDGEKAKEREYSNNAYDRNPEDTENMWVPEYPDDEEDDLYESRLGNIIREAMRKTLNDGRWI